uniref:Uncharacterized protein n=1 Tax=Meloidogyne enterolobii TaxID=390850 RepID=A0A6V7TY14_MELEN|nr:unnamed protein product [Meloidogyne enterolobii]
MTMFAWKTTSKCSYIKRIFPDFASFNCVKQTHIRVCRNRI